MPYSYLSVEFSYWTKRLIRSLYGENVPGWIIYSYPIEDGNWNKPEN